MGKIISDGTSYTCSHCSSPIKIKVCSSPCLGDSKALANTVNTMFPPPGAQCLITSNLCVPDTSVAEPGQCPVQIDGKPGLGANNKFSCSKGGVLKPSNVSQGSVHHTKTTPKKAEKIKCSLIRTNILSEAHSIAKSAAVIYYTEDPDHRTGATPAGDQAYVQCHDFHKTKQHHHAWIKGPVISYDCSGFVSTAFLKAGKPLKGTYPVVKTIYRLPVFKEIPAGKAQPGDLVVWIGSTSNHVGVYEGHGNFISAMRNVQLKDGFMSSIRSIKVTAFGGHPHYLRYIDCIEEP